MKKRKSVNKKVQGIQKTRCANIENQPRFIRASFYNANRFKSVRSQGFHQRYLIASLLKERGNRLFKLGLICYAITEYEQALSLFSFFETVHYANVVEEDLYQVQYLGESEREISLLKDLRLKLYMNLAACYLKQKLNEDVIKSCDFALEIDATQAKAYYRRAQARLPGDLGNALADLRKASELAPNDIEVQKELNKTNSLLKIKQAATMGNCDYKLQKRPQLHQIEEPDLQVPPPSSCSSSSMYDSEPEEMTNEEATQFWQQFNIQKDYENFNYELSYEEDPQKPVPQEVNELGHFIEYRGVEMLRAFESQGKIKEAQQLQEKLKKALAAKAQLEKISRLDFSRPKPHLQEIALRFGINLLENQVQNEFRRIQQQNIQDIKNWLQQNQWKSAPIKPADQQQQLHSCIYQQAKSKNQTEAHSPNEKTSSQISESESTNQLYHGEPEGSSSEEDLFQGQSQGQGSQKSKFQRERQEPDVVIQRQVHEYPENPIIEQPQVHQQQAEGLSTAWSPLVMKIAFINMVVIILLIVYRLLFA